MTNGLVFSKQRQNVLRDESYRPLRSLFEKLDLFRIMKMRFLNLRAPRESLKKIRIIRSIFPEKMMPLSRTGEQAYAKALLHSAANQLF
jgi:hypothetical protein